MDIEANAVIKVLSRKLSEANFEIAVLTAQVEALQAAAVAAAKLASETEAEASE